MKNKAVLYLNDGTLLEGSFFGAPGESSGEVVFNTAMTGYEEIITDPSYCGQIVTMCYPQIGNYGINIDDAQGYGVWARGLVVREYSKSYSNWDAKMSLHKYLVDQNITAIEGLDTRYLVRKIRKRGSMKGIISTEDFSPGSLKKKLEELPEIKGRNLVSEVNRDSMSVFRNFKSGPSDGPNVTVLDYGVKLSILRSLQEQGFNITVLPGDSGIEDVLSTEPDGVLLSNGPGDPAAVDYAVKLARDLMDFNRQKPLPVLGICLGSQMIALAGGGETYKLKFGHHGGNHPVKDLRNSKIEITVQNHGFAVVPETLPDEFKKTHINLNDNTVEGIKHKDLPVVGYQHHPEAGPGPVDAQYVFGQFKEMVDACKN